MRRARHSPASAPTISPVARAVRAYADLVISPKSGRYATARNPDPGGTKGGPFERWDAEANERKDLGASIEPSLQVGSQVRR
jgi:hypothetical protein